jgi:DNA-binding MarR family transcriptional regulator
MSTGRGELIGRVLLSARELSTATVMLHAVLSDIRGLSLTESKALDLLERFGPLSAGELAERSGLAPASVTGLVDRLERKGIARRLPHPTDGRRVLIGVDEERLRSYDALFEDFVAAVTEMCGQYTDDELETIISYNTHAAQRCHDSATQLAHTHAHEPQH